MKYLALFEWSFEDLERLGKIWEQLIEEREKGSDKFPKKLLFEPQALQAELYQKTRERQTFFIFETDDPMHLTNYRLHLAPYMDLNFIPLTSIFIAVALR